MSLESLVDLESRRGLFVSDMRAESEHPPVPANVLFSNLPATKPAPGARWVYVV